MIGLTELESIRAESHDPENPPAQELEDILGRVKTIAVVGMSANPAKPARRGPAYLKTKGYSIIPVNPRHDRILGLPSVARLSDVTDPVDMVVVFRPSKDAAGVLKEAAARPEHPVIWLQEGIMAPLEAAAARLQGRTVVQDLCASKVHKSLSQDD